MTTTASTTSSNTGPVPASQIPWWTPGDWNAFFGFGTNILVNILVLTGLLRFVLKLPDDIVFGRILPAVGLMLFLSTVYYAYLARKLAVSTGRTDVCALPSGISVPHMFVVTFVVMLPILIKTGNPLEAWGAGLTWVFIQSFVLMAGGFAAPIIRRITPRAALLGSLAGISLTFIAMSPGAQLFMTPLIGVVCLAVILASWLGNYRYPGGIPGGLMAIIIGSIIAWGANLMGYPLGGVGPDKVQAALSSFSFHVPLPAFVHIAAGFKYIGIILVTAIPFGIYDLVEAMDNVESAEAAGDHFPTTRVLTADGIISLIGCCMGNPFINAVYIGHPGWKAMGGRVGYSAATGVLMLVLTWFGVVALMMAIIPAVALLPILLYIGMLIGAQAFQESPHRHAPAIVLAIVPTIANWGATQINNALASAGTNVGKVGYDALASNGVLLEGLQVLGSGATLAGIILGSIAVMIIDGKLLKGAYFALTGAALTFFGLIHSEAGIGVMQTPMVAAAYLIVGIFLAICSRKEQIVAEIEEAIHSHGHGHGHGHATAEPAE